MNQIYKLEMETNFQLLTMQSENTSLSTIGENKENENENYIDWNKKLEEAEQKTDNTYANILERRYYETWTPAEQRVKNQMIECGMTRKSRQSWIDIFDKVFPSHV